MKSTIFFIVSIIFFWLALLGIPNTQREIVIATAVTGFILFISYIFSLIPHKISFKISALKYILWLWKEMIISSLEVTKLCWSKRPVMHPMLGTIKSIQKSNLGIALYANSITLTPGTVTLSTQENILLVHAIDVKFLDDLNNQTMDKNIKEILR